MAWHHHHMCADTFAFNTYHLIQHMHPTRHGMAWQASVVMFTEEAAAAAAAAPELAALAAAAAAPAPAAAAAL